jgi:murein L,D-transpeptidase YafK
MLPLGLRQQHESARSMQHRPRLPLTLLLPVLFAIASASTPLEARTGFVDRVVIEKSTRTLKLLAGDEIYRTYFVALGGAPEGAKVQEGDLRTPEGVYSIVARQPRSTFYRGLLISYPNADDIARAEALGVDPGGEIMIHGLRNGYEWMGERHRRQDWTEGCIAVTNQEIDEIWQLVDIGTPVEIRP